LADCRHHDNLVPEAAGGMDKAFEDVALVGADD
jgi:hypothetical protein